ncbi:MAG: hypothetical protein JSW09_11545 [Pseudomonadota bacterium]|nr:MAG: hypothetical protein JSW09_11545 [Pseudomonadota bacterium]
MGRKRFWSRLTLAGFGMLAATAVLARHDMLDEKTRVDMMRAHDMTHMSMLADSTVIWELRKDLALTGNRMSGGGGMQSGDFGTATRTTTFDLTFEIGKSTDEYDLSASLPWLYDRTSNGTTHTESGVGDLRLTASRTFLAPAEGLFASGSVMVKVPTADESEGLGTGEFDAGVSATVGHKFAANRIGLTLGYIVVGDPPDIDYDNRAFASVFWSRKLGEKTGGYVSLDTRTAMFDDLDNPVSFGFGYYGNVGEHYTIGIDTGIGLNDTASDYYASAYLSLWF